MESEDRREEGEISDDEDVIITQVTHAKHDWKDKGERENVPCHVHDQTRHERHRSRKAGDQSKLLKQGASTNTHITKSSTVLRSANKHSVLVQTQTETSRSARILSPTCSTNVVLPQTPETLNSSSGFIDRMRRKGTPIFSPLFTHNFSYLPNLPSDDVTGLMHGIDVASIPTPPPPPLPKTPPPNIPLPPPECNSNSAVADGSKAGDIDDEFVDTLLEEATKQIAQDLDDMQDKTEVVDMELDSSDDGEILDDSDSKIILSNPMEDDDEDLDVLELRLAALASYAKSTRQQLEERKEDKSTPYDEFYGLYEPSRTHQKYPEYIPSNRRDFTERKRKRSGDVDLSRKRYEEERTEREKRKRIEERLKREEEKRFKLEDAYRRERSLRADEKKERRRLQQVEQKLTDLQNIMDPATMLQKMLELAPSQMLQKVLELAGGAPKVAPENVSGLFGNSIEKEFNMASPDAEVPYLTDDETREGNEAVGVGSESVDGGNEAGDEMEALRDRNEASRDEMEDADLRYVNKDRVTVIEADASAPGVGSRSNEPGETTVDASLTNPQVSRDGVLQWLERHCEPVAKAFTHKARLWSRMCQDFNMYYGDKEKVMTWLPDIITELGWDVRTVRSMKNKKLIGMKLIEQSIHDVTQSKAEDLANEISVSLDSIRITEMSTNEICVTKEATQSHEMVEYDADRVAMYLDADVGDDEQVRHRDSEFAYLEGDIFEKTINDRKPDDSQESEVQATIFPKPLKPQSSHFKNIQDAEKCDAALPEATESQVESLNSMNCASNSCQFEVSSSSHTKVSSETIPFIGEDLSNLESSEHELRQEDGVVIKGKESVQGEIPPIKVQIPLVGIHLENTTKASSEIFCEKIQSIISDLNVVRETANVLSVQTGNATELQIPPTESHDSDSSALHDDMQLEHDRQTGEDVCAVSKSIHEMDGSHNDSDSSKVTDMFTSNDTGEQLSSEETSLVKNDVTSQSDEQGSVCARALRRLSELRRSRSRDGDTHQLSIIAEDAAHENRELADHVVESKWRPMFKEAGYVHTEPVKVPDEPVSTTEQVSTGYVVVSSVGQFNTPAVPAQSLQRSDTIDDKSNVDSKLSDVNAQKPVESIPIVPDSTENVVQVSVSNSEDTEQESLLRAELLAAVSRKRREKLEVSMKKVKSPRKRSKSSDSKRRQSPRIRSKPTEESRNKQRSPSVKVKVKNKENDKKDRARSDRESKPKVGERSGKKAATKRKWEESDVKKKESDEEEESLLRAQLLASVARKRRERYEAEIAKHDAEVKAMAKIAEQVKSGSETENKHDKKSQSRLSRKERSIIPASNRTRETKTNEENTNVKIHQNVQDCAENMDTMTVSVCVTGSSATISNVLPTSAIVPLSSKACPVATHVIEDPSCIPFELTTNKRESFDQNNKPVILKPQIAPPSLAELETSSNWTAQQVFPVYSNNQVATLGSEALYAHSTGLTTQHAVDELRMAQPALMAYGSVTQQTPMSSATVAPGLASFVSIAPDLTGSMIDMGGFVPTYAQAMTSVVPDMMGEMAPVTRLVPEIAPGAGMQVSEMSNLYTGIPLMPNTTIPPPGYLPPNVPFPGAAYGVNEPTETVSGEIHMSITTSAHSQATGGATRVVSFPDAIPTQTLTPESVTAQESTIENELRGSELLERRVEIVRTIPTLSNRQVNSNERIVEILRIKKHEHINSKPDPAESEIEMRKTQKRKQRRKLRQKVKEEALKIVKEKSAPMLKHTPSIYSMPVVNPVVINLHEDSTDEETQQPTHKPISGLLSSLDSFLKNVRASVEQNSEATMHPNTPEALKNLGSKHVEEYKKLKEEIRKREEKLRGNQLTKQATKHVEPAADDSVEQAKKVHQLELRVTLQKKMMDQDEQNLATLKSLVSKKKHVVDLAEQKMEHLEEQLQAARRIHKSNIEQIATLNIKCNTCEKQIETRRDKLKDLGNQMLEMGRQTFGSTYTPFQQSKRRLFAYASSKGIDLSNAATNAKRIHKSNSMSDLEKLSSTVQPMPHTERGHAASGTGGTMQTVERNYGNDRQLLKQKENEVIQLEKLQKQYRELIERHHREKTTLTSQAPHVPEHIETQETMHVSSNDIPEEITEMNLKPRRRSILDSAQGSSTKPNLAVTLSPMKDAWLRDKLVKGLGGRSDGETSSRESSPKPGTLQPSGFNMPAGPHLLNLSKLHKENLRNDAWFNKSEAELLSSQNRCDTSISVIPGVKYRPQLSSNKRARVDTNQSKLKAYSSPLLRFKSYRFSPYYRTKARKNLTSVTFSNKVDAKRMFCQFDLTGTCNDDKCPWQHQSALPMSSKEVLGDLASYSPAVAGISSEAPLENYSKEINNFVSKFRTQNPVPDSQQCVLMVSHVNEATKHVPPHTTFVEARGWRPTLPPQEESDKESVYSFIVDKAHSDITAGKVFEDDILSCEDVRYWMQGSEAIPAMESGVLEDKHNVHLWIKLAYKKLHDRNPNESNLDQALNVMSRALEANKNSAELWLHYLGMFSRHKDKSDLLLLCKQALLYAPSYELHFKYLTVLPTFSMKKVHCKKIEEFLRAAQCTESDDVRSHHVLEIILYCVQLCVLSGRTSRALQIMQEKYKGDVSVLTLSDLVLLSLCYIHMLEYRCLPHSLFDSATSVPGRIVNKESFVISWKSKSDKHGAIIHDVIARCSEHSGAKAGQVALVPLYKTLLLYDIFNGRMDGLETMCKSWYTEGQPLCFLKLSLEVATHVYDNERILQMYDGAIKRAALLDVEITYRAVYFMLSIGNTNQALECLEHLPTQFFEIGDGETWDPSQLYCKLLKQSLPLNCKLPRQLDITEEVIKPQLPYLWACYCLILELQGFQSEVHGCYEAAIASLVHVPDLRFIWHCCLKHYRKELTELSSTSQLRKASHLLQLANQFQYFTALVKRSLVSVPTKLPLPCNPDSYWLDYSFHCDVIELYVVCLGADDRVKAYEEFVKMMPDNIRLVIRACEYFYEYGAKPLALGVSRVALEDHKHSLPLWKLHLMVANDINNTREVLRIYRRATQAVPQSLWLWTNYLLLEATHGKEQNVKHILQKCKDLEINLGDFVTHVLKYSA